jgi:prolyl-tRNA synthetase
VPILKDAAIRGSGLVCGANQPDAHLIGVEPGRDFSFEEVDVRAVEAGDTTASGATIRIEPAIEIGNIFKLGTRYSEPLGATYLDPDGKERPIVMGSYGIGLARIAAAAIEQRADEKGIVWPAALAPWQVHLVSLGKAGDEVAAAADELYEALSGAGIETLYDERESIGPGEKFTVAELLGCPLRLTVGRRGLADGVAESQQRADGAEQPIELAGAPERVRAILGELG